MRSGVQQWVTVIFWAALGLIATGGALDAIVNSISLQGITLHLAAAVAVCWIILELVLRFRGIDWTFAANGRHQRVRALGPKYRAGIIGALLLLVLPHTLPQASAPAIELHPLSSTPPKVGVNETIVLVADFESDPSQSNFQVTRKIATALKESLPKNASTNMRMLGKHIPWRSTAPGESQFGRDVAVATGNGERGSLIVWGDFTATGSTAIINVNVDPLDRLPRGIGVSFHKEVKIPLSTLNSYDAQDRVAVRVQNIVWTVLGFVRLTSGDYKAAEELFRGGTTSAAPSDMDGSIAFTEFYLGFSCWASGDLKCALTSFDRVLAKYPNNYQVVFDRSTVLAMSGDLDSAEQGYLQLLETAQSDDERVQARAGLGRLLMERGQYRKAEAEFRQALSLRPKYSEGWVFLGGSQLELGRPKEALDSYRHAESFLNSPIYLTNRATAEYRLGLLSEALSHIETSVARSPGWMFHYSIRGAIHLEQRDFQRAKLDFEEIIKHRGLSSESSVTSFMLGGNLFLPPVEKTDDSSAAKALATAYLGRARANLGIGEKEASAADFREARGINESAMNFVRDCGGTLGDLGRFDAAIAECDDALVFQPLEASALVNRARWELGARNLNGARTDLATTLKAHPTYVRAWVGQANIALSLGDAKQAEKDAKTAVQLDPKSAYAHDALANALFRLNKLEDALRAINVAIELNRNSAAYYITRGEIACRAGSYQLALNSYAQALQIIPNNYVALNNRADCRSRNSDLSKALADSNRALELAPEQPSLLETRGSIYRRMRNWPAALADYDASLRLSPEFDYSLLGRGLVLIELSQFEQGRRCLEKVLSITHNTELKDLAKSGLQRLSAKSSAR